MTLIHDVAAVNNGTSSFLRHFFGDHKFCKSYSRVVDVSTLVYENLRRKQYTKGWDGFVRYVWLTVATPPLFLCSYVRFINNSRFELKNHSDQAFFCGVHVNDSHFMLGVVVQSRGNVFTFQLYDPLRHHGAAGSQCVETVGGLLRG